MSDFAIGALGFTTAFASTVWIIVGTSSVIAKRWLEASAYIALILVNLFSTVVIVGLLIDRPFDLPRGSTTLILLPLIGLPPILQLRWWLIGRALIALGRGEADE